MDAVKEWLQPLFQPLVDVAYWAERREYPAPGPTIPSKRRRDPSPEKHTSQDR